MGWTQGEDAATATDRASSIALRTSSVKLYGPLESGIVTRLNRAA